MAGITQVFTLRTSSNVSTAHLVGSWDNYTGQLPLSGAGKKGAWKGTFKFTGSTLKPGQRYWYYYVLDGYSVTHDPAQNYTKEPTTGRLLNILDVPAAVAARGNLPPLQIPRGRGVSPSRIACPKPSKPYASQKIRQADYSRSPVDYDSASDLAGRLEAASLYSPGSASSSSSSSPRSVFSSGRSSAASSGPASPASLSSLSDASQASSCRCNRFGITRSGKRVLLDCGGSRCGYSSDDCSTDGSGSDFDSDSDNEPEIRKPIVRTIAPKSTTTTRDANIVLAAPRKSAAVSSSSRRR